MTSQNYVILMSQMMTFKSELWDRSRNCHKFKLWDNCD